MLRKLGLFLLGGFVGGVLSYIYVKETRLIPLEEEISDLNAWLIERDREKTAQEDFSENKSHHLDDEKEEDGSDPVLLKDVLDYQKEASRYLYGGAELLIEISEEEYENGALEREEWTEIELQWYAYEKELRDSNDRLISNVGEFLGDEDFEPPETWYDASNGVIFLRNSERKVDFRVELNEMRPENGEEEI